MLRLYALREDFSDFGLMEESHSPMKILDAGGGMGQFSSELASIGHQVELCDISQEMLEEARTVFLENAPEASPAFSHCSIQNIPAHYPESFDVVINHAVLEWLEDPLSALDILCDKVKPGGWLSLMFYNQHGRTWRGMMNGKLHAPSTSNERMAKEGIAPQQPLNPSVIHQYLTSAGMNIERWRGIRFIYDHMHQKIRDRVGLEAIAQSESEFGCQPPYRDLARYVHMLCKKPEQHSPGHYRNTL